MKYTYSMHNPFLPFLSRHRKIGLSVSDFSVEVAEASTKNVGRSPLEPGTVSRGVITDPEKLRTAIMAALRAAGVRALEDTELLFGFPVDQTFVHIFDQPAGGEDRKDVESVVVEELRRSVPLPSTELSHGYVASTGAVPRIVAIAAKRSIVAQWEFFLKQFKFADVQLLAGVFAPYSALHPAEDLLPICLVDIGTASVAVSVYDARGACFASSFTYAGEASAQKAEIVRDIKDSLRFCHEKRGVDALHLLLIGEVDRVPELLEHLKAETGVSVSKGYSRYLPEPGDEVYLRALGLALSDATLQIPHFEHREAGDTPLEREKKTPQAPESVAPAEAELPTPGMPSYEPESSELGEEAARLTRQKILLVSIVLAGAALVALSFWYSAVQDQQHKAQIASETKNYSFASSLPLSVNIAVSPNEQTAGRIVGRVIANTIEIFGTENEAVQTSRISVTAQLSKTETLWKEPLSVSSAPSPSGTVSGQKVVDYTVRWLAYDETATNAALTAAADAQMKKTGIPYSVSNIEKQSIEIGQTPSLYVLHAVVIIASESQVPDSVPSAAATTTTAR